MTTRDGEAGAFRDLRAIRNPHSLISDLRR
jgi:hypothetical protein